jgi:2-oxoglutarate dehydrogenase E2 component (dihydrolipoamide succinyltransferase)
MIVEVVMPKMGESLQEGTIINWLKKEGDVVERDEMILEISTDKVDTEVPSPVAGILKKIHVPVETTVLVGTLIAEIETDASASASAPAPVAVAAAPVVEVAPVPAPVAVETPAPAAAAPVATAPVSGGNTIDLVMPKMGESLQEGTIVKWLKKVGDVVERDEMVLEISTDKVDTEVPSPVAGTLVEILAQEEETLLVGSVIARISTGGSAVASAPVAAPAPVQAAAPVAQTTIAAPVATPAPVASAPTPVAAPAQVVGQTFEIPRQHNGKFFSPLVKEIAKQNRVSLEELMTLNGTGMEGRITKADILSYVANRGSAPAPAPVAQSAPVVASAPVAPAPVASASVSAPKPMAPAPMVGSDSYDVIPMDRMRQLISAHMTMSKATSAHVTSVAEVDFSNIVKIRDKFKAQFEKNEGFKLTFTPFFAKAVVDAVRQFPMVNVSVDGKNILKHKRVNLAFATALPDNNLIVPVIKGSESLNLTGLARGVYDLSTRARNKQLAPDDVQNGTVTITNVGTFGTLFGTPIINQPQTCIFGIGAIKKRPMAVEVNGEWLVAIRDVAFISITYDHRVIDGMLAGQTLAAVVKALETMNLDNVQF